MYLASFDLAGRAIVQAKVALPPVMVSAAQRYRSVLNHVLSTLPAIPNVSAAVRIVLRNQSLSQGWIFTTDARNETSLRRMVSGLTRIERLAGVGVGFPADAGSFDRLIENFPEARCRITCGGFSRDKIWFACPYRLFDSLDRVFGEAAALKIDCGYQAHLTANSVTEDFARAALRNAVHINAMRGVRPAVAERQQDIARRAIRSPWLIEEIAGCAPAQSEWLAAFLRRGFNEQLGGDGFVCPDFTPSIGDLDAEIESGLHRALFEDLTPEERCASAIDEPGAIGVLAWTPGERLATLLPDLPPDDPGHGESARPPVIPAPPSKPADYSFVSYSHADSHVVAPCVERAGRAGINLWWDHQIPGGSEWDCYLEERIEAARTIILFLSQRAVDSKYVRREIKYADAIGKPILAIEVAPGVHLRHGMSMLLNQYQRIAINCDNLYEQIRAFS